MKEKFDVTEEKVEEVIEGDAAEVLTEEEIQDMKDDQVIIDNATDELFIEKNVLSHWLDISFIVDNLEELQFEMNDRFQQVKKLLDKGLDKLDRLKEKIAPYEDD